MLWRVSTVSSWTAPNTHQLSILLRSPERSKETLCSIASFSINCTLPIHHCGNHLGGRQVVIYKTELIA